EVFLVLLGQFAKRLARAVDQRLPADGFRPAFKALALDPGCLVVMEDMRDTIVFKPGSRLLHGVAVLDPVDRDLFRFRFGHGPLHVRCPVPNYGPRSVFSSTSRPAKI